MHISLATKGLHCDVRDTGAGIAQEGLTRLFSSFSQVDASTTRRFGGTGLGLTISKRLIECMGGAIGVDSVVGEGSRFWFCLPLDTVDDPHKNVPMSVAVQHTPAAVAEQTVHILLAEDHIVNQKLALTLLGRLGYTVDLAENGKAAVEAAAARRYTLILMDMQMPEMDGLEATRQIRAQPGPNQATYIIALTANAMQSEKDACSAAGMNDFLSKPFNRESLAQCITKALTDTGRGHYGHTIAS